MPFADWNFDLDAESPGRFAGVGCRFYFIANGWDTEKECPCPVHCETEGGGEEIRSSRLHEGAYGKAVGIQHHAQLIERVQVRG